MNWGFICLISLLIFSLISIISALSMARWGDEEKLREMPYINSIRAQFEVYGKVRKSNQKALEQNKEHYQELSDSLENLEAGDSDSK